MTFLAEMEHCIWCLCARLQLQIFQRAMMIDILIKLRPSGRGVLDDGSLRSAILNLNAHLVSYRMATHSDLRVRDTTAP